MYYRGGSSVILTYGYAGGTQALFGQVEILDVRLVKPGIISRPVEYPFPDYSYSFKPKKKNSLNALTH